MQGPALPYALSSHAMINMENGKTMVIGGWTESGAPNTHIFNHYNEVWSVGPSLIKVRYLHAAGIVTDEATMNTYAIVTGGHDGSSFFKSTEILKGHTWSSGKNFFSIKRSKTTKRQDSA